MISSSWLMFCFYLFIHSISYFNLNFGFCFFKHGLLKLECFDLARRNKLACVCSDLILLFLKKNSIIFKLTMMVINVLLVYLNFFALDTFIFVFFRISILFLKGKYFSFRFLFPLFFFLGSVFFYYYFHHQ